MNGTAYLISINKEGSEMKKRILITTVSVISIAVCIFMLLHYGNILMSKMLVKAIERNDIRAVEQILKINPHCADTYPQTLPERCFNYIMEERGDTYPLIVACGWDNFEIVKMLVEAGADTDCNDGRTPLSLTYSAKKEHWYQISLYLIESGASLDYVTEYSGGNSSILMDIACPRPGGALEGYIPDKEEEVINAFHYAIEHCNQDKVNWIWVLQDNVIFDRIEIVKFLLDENYCDVNDTRSSGMTALMHAARNSDVEMTQLLLDRGADKSCVDEDGKTAYDYAVEYGKEDIAELLANTDE